MDFQGAVLLQRKQPQGWSPFQAVRRRGVALVSQDRLEVKLGAEALVRCTSQGRRLWTVESGGPFPVSRGCGPETVLRQALRTEGLPGGGNPRIPYLITPRATSWRGNPVLLRWNPVEGVRGYQVWLLRERDQRLLWGVHVENTSSTLLPPGVSLIPGEHYRVVVEADDGSSSVLDSGADRQSFRLATPAELSALERQRSRMPQTGLDPEAVALLEADLLSQYDLLDEAITTLERHLSREGPRLGVLLELGHLYGRIGLNKRSAERFREAASLASAGDIQEALAEAQAGALAASQRWRRSGP